MSKYRVTLDIDDIEQFGEYLVTTPSGELVLLKGWFK
jgi:hypothetical protein